LGALMARWGARIKNASTGSVQIDDLYANMAFISKNTFTTGSTTLTGGNVSTGSITYTSTELPLVAFACTSPIAVNNVVRDNGANTWTFVLVAEGTSKNITCYQFGEPPVLGAGWGMRIKRDGVVKFDSRHKYARIASSLRGTFDVNSSVGSTGPTTTLTSGRTYAIMFGGLTSRRGTAYTPGSGGYTASDYLYGLLASVNSNVIASKFVVFTVNNTFYPVPPSPPMPSSWNRDQGQYSWAILDVTGY
jgi:hypothetical protein